MPLYEIMAIATVHSTPAQLTNMLGKLAIVVQKGKGVFRRVENLGVRPLAHRMKAHMKYNEEGRFMRLFIQASPVLCADIEQRLRIDDTIVKTMTIKHKQPAPVVLPKRVHNLKIMDSSSVTGILHHAPVLEYHVADVLLRFGLMREDDILGLRRYKDDAGWDALRQEKLLERARGGSAAAASVLQIPIPSRAEDLRDIARISAKEEAQIAAFDAYRRATAARRQKEREEYKHNEEMAMRRRLAWYAEEGQFIRHRALTKRLNKLRREGTKRLTVDEAIKLQSERDMAKRAKVKQQYLRTQANRQMDTEALQPDLTVEEHARDFGELPVDEESAKLEAEHQAFVEHVRAQSAEEREVLKAGMSAKDWEDLEAEIKHKDELDAEKKKWAEEDAAEDEEEALLVEQKRAELSGSAFQRWMQQRDAAKAAELDADEDEDEEFDDDEEFDEDEDEDFDEDEEGEFDEDEDVVPPAASATPAAAKK